MANRVTYGAAAEEVVDLFKNYFDGSSYRPYLVISFTQLGAAAISALNKSLETLGYGNEASSFITIQPETEQGALDPCALHLLIEGIDPYRIICADEKAAQELNRAYDANLKLNAINRIMGRSSGIFSDLNRMVQDEKDKYIAWEIFKALK